MSASEADHDDLRGRLFDGVVSIALRSYLDRPAEVQLIAEHWRDQMHAACPDLTADQMGRAVVAASVVLATPQARASEEGQLMLRALSLLGGSLLQGAAADGG